MWFEIWSCLKNVSSFLSPLYFLDHNFASLDQFNKENMFNSSLLSVWYPWYSPRIQLKSSNFIQLKSWDSEISTRQTADPRIFFHQLYSQQKLERLLDQVSHEKKGPWLVVLNRWLYYPVI